MKKTKKKIITFTAIAAAVATLAVTLMTIFIPGAKTISPAEPESTGNIIIDDTISHGIKLSSYLIPQEEYEMYNVSPLAETAQQVTATITPSDATNKQVDWSVAWNNASSTWATGKTVSDYVTVTPSSDGALTATVTCLQGFSEKVVLKVVLRAASNIQATANIDYKFRVTGVSDFSVAIGNLFTISNSTSTVAFPFSGNSVDAFFGTAGAVQTASKTFSCFPNVIGTLSQMFDVKMSIELADTTSSNTYKQVITDSLLTSKTVAVGSVAKKSFTYSGVPLNGQTFNASGASLFLIDSSLLGILDYYAFKRNYSKQASNINWQVKIEFTADSGDTYTYTHPFKFNASSEKYVEDITLGSGSIIF